MLLGNTELYNITGGCRKLKRIARFIRVAIKFKLVRMFR